MSSGNLAAATGGEVNTDMTISDNSDIYKYKYISIGATATVIAFLLGMVFAIVIFCAAGDAMAQSISLGKGGGGGWASAIKDKGEEFKLGLLSLAGVACGIGGAWIFTLGAIAGEVNWRRVGSLGFAMVALVSLDMVIQNFIGQ